MGEVVAEANANGNGALRRRPNVEYDGKTQQRGSSVASVPVAKWTFGRDGIPQAVAHRGYKAEYPENTMGAFRGAVQVGAHAIETDLHLSKEGVVVISHDKDLKRCFGQPSLVRDCTWEYLSTLKTTRAPASPMPRLLDVLDFLAEPGTESTWLLLDIKVDDAPEDMIPRIAETLAAAAHKGDWTQRVVLGCWTAKHMRLCHELLPDFAIAFIGIRLELAREFMKVPNVAMNMRQEPLFGIGGPRFIRDCQHEGRPLYAWTVNQPAWMRWAVDKKLDCVMTDDPKLYLEIARSHRDRRGERGQQQQKSTGLLATVWDASFYYLVPLLTRMHTVWYGYYGRVGSPADNRKELRKWHDVYQY